MIERGGLPLTDAGLKKGAGLTSCLLMVLAGRYCELASLPLTKKVNVTQASEAPESVPNFSPFGRLLQDKVLRQKVRLQKPSIGGVLR
jgi:hypothetical protein